MDLLDRLRAAPGAEPVLEALAGEAGVHVVGGAVRDALLERAPRELDFVVEGRAEPVAARVAARLGGDVVVHERFATTTVRAAAGTFDLVSARRERYSRPGTLPEVDVPTPLAEDLARRDFTVNAIALRVEDGELTAHPGAHEDLGAGVLRALHPGSFLDDPTRMLRLARYAARLGFAVEPGTDALATSAVAAGATATVSGERLGAELRRLLLEPQPPALLALERHGLGAAVVHPAFDPASGLIEAAVALCPPDARADLVALAACLAAAPPAEVAQALERLGFTAPERRTVEAAVATAEALAEALADGNPVVLQRALRGRPPEAVALAGALAGAEHREAARRWLADLRHRRLAITGHDLVAAGLSGPAVGRALQAATEAMLAGTAPGREGQLAAALGAEPPS